MVGLDTCHHNGAMHHGASSLRTQVLYATACCSSSPTGGGWAPKGWRVGGWLGWAAANDPQANRRTRTHASCSADCPAEEGAAWQGRAVAAVTCRHHHGHGADGQLPLAPYLSCGAAAPARVLLRQERACNGAYAAPVGGVPPPARLPLPPIPSPAPPPTCPACPRPARGRLQAGGGGAEGSCLGFSDACDPPSAVAA